VISVTLLQGAEEVSSQRGGLIAVFGKDDPEFQAPGLAPAPELIRNQLKKILASRLFRSSQLQRQFLKFVILNALDGRSSEIKEYSIGADAFGRGQDFDPRVDSVVRVVARRVRVRLAEYYRYEGKADPIIITMPVGSYIPSFSCQEQGDGSAAISPSPSPVRPSPSAVDGLIGVCISHYEILDLIARGTSGLVYRAEDLRLKRGVAFKILFPELASDTGRLQRFLREARFGSAVNHPNVCAVYDVGEFEGRAYIVMELVEGQTLDRFIDGKPLPVETLLELSIQICDALAVIHSQGIVHRDVRSANIIVNNQCRAKLLDFSAAQATGESVEIKPIPATARQRIATRARSAVGTQSPISPEPSLGASTRYRADTRGMGEILFEMATGCAPSSAPETSALACNPHLPRELDSLIAAMLRADVAIQSISDIRDELLHIRSSVQNRLAPRSGLRMHWVWIASALAAAVVAALYYGFFYEPSPPSITKYTQITHDGQGKLIRASGPHGELVTDGSRIYFSEIRGTEVGISQAAVSGGETIPLQTDPGRPLVIRDISPDNSKLLVIDFYRPSLDFGFQILPLPGGSPYTLGNVTGHDAVWSPDGSRLVYASGNDLYISDAAGGNSRKLIHCPDFPYWPRWSPDGKTLRLTLRDRDGATSLWEVSSEGTNLHRIITASPGAHSSDCCGSWSPNGNFFIFQSESNGRTHISLLAKGREAPIQLTNGPLSFSAPIFSKDGKQIFAIAIQRRGELVRYDASRKDFSIYLSGISADHVEFSRDQRSIAYSSYPDSAIWRSGVDGQHRLQLSPPGMMGWFPRWSPDGKQIAFMGSQPGGPLKIYLVSASGGVPEVLVPGPASEIDPNWSPDGRSILFGAVPSATGLGAGRSEIRILDLRTRRVSKLPGSEELSEPRWSPDGRFVVATALSQHRWRDPGVVIFDFKSGKWTGFEKDPIDNKWFSADGQYYYFDKYVDNDPAIFRIRVSDRKLERVAGLKDIRRAQSVSGWWMGLTPDGSPMVLRDTSIEEIYALDFKAH